MKHSSAFCGCAKKKFCISNLKFMLLFGGAPVMCVRETCPVHAVRACVCVREVCAFPFAFRTNISRARVILLTLAPACLVRWRFFILLCATRVSDVVVWDILLTPARPRRTEYISILCSRATAATATDERGGVVVGRYFVVCCFCCCQWATELRQAQQTHSSSSSSSSVV